MKNKIIWSFGVVLFGLSVFGTGLVVGQNSGELPNLTTACETKAGLLFGINDGFSILKKCPGNSQMVTLGQTNGDDEEVNIPGMAFMTTEGANIWLLTETGDVYSLDINDRDWRLQNDKKIEGNLVSGISQWFVNSYLTKNGEIFALVYDEELGKETWILVGLPTE